MLPPGRARLATKPVPTGSFESEDDGMVEVTRRRDDPAPAVTMTSTLPSELAAICVKLVVALPSDIRC
jgi:hypothetical protein